MLKLDLILGSPRGYISGTKRILYEIYSRLDDVGINFIEMKNINLHLGKTFYIVYNRYFYHPNIVKKHYRKDAFLHIGSQYFMHLLRVFPNSILWCFDLARIKFVDDWSLTDNIMRKRDYTHMRKVRKIITLSNFSKKEIIEEFDICSDRINVVYPGIDHEKFIPIKFDKKVFLSKYGVEGQDKIILYVGSEHRRKNLLTLIKAFYQLKKRVKNVRFLKVGNPQHPNQRKEILDLVNKLSLKDSITILDYVDDKDIPLLYNSAYVFVFPSLYEGFGLPPLEAMACGIPVITSNASSLPEVVGDASIMVEPTDIVGFAAQMERVLCDELLRETLIEKGIEQAKKFTWDKAAQKMEEIYKGL